MKWCMHLWLLVTEGPGDSLCVGVWSELFQRQSLHCSFGIKLNIKFGIKANVWYCTFTCSGSSHNARHSFPAFWGKQW